MTALQKVLFQWTPRHFATPASQVVYRLKVCRVPDGEEPNEQTLLACTEPVLDQTVPATSLTGDQTQWIQPLQTGQRYAVQVQATDLNNQLTNFAHQGYSQVQWFRYGRECAPPPSFTIKSVTSDRVRLNWETQPQALAYVVEYKAETAADWTAVKVYATTHTVTGLQNKTTYLFRLRSDCGGLLPSAPSEEQSWNISQEAPEAAPEWPKELLQPELISVQTLDTVAVPVTTLQELYVNFPVPTTNPAGDTPPSGAKAPSPPAATATNGPVPLTTKLKIPDCALRAGSFADCLPTHPVIPLPAADLKELTALSVGDVLGIYDFAVFVTKVGDGPGLSGEGLVRLPFLGNALAPVEFKGVKAKKEEGDANGGCVYEVDPAGVFQLKNDVEAKELAERRQALIQALVQKSQPQAFVGTLQQALQRYDLTAKAISEAKQAGQPATPEQRQQLLQFTAAILQGSGALKTQLDALGTDNEPVTTLLKDLRALTDELEANRVTIGQGTDVPVITDLEAKYLSLFERLKQLTATPAEPPVLPSNARITNVGIGNIDFQSAALTWTGTGGKAFAKYSILYAADGEGELTQTVTSPQLALKNLKPGRNYTYKIVGYSETGEVLDTYGTATFSTPARTLPPPENLTYTVQTDGSVRINWNKNSLHQSFKLTYKTASGEERTLYPTTNSATLTGLALDRTYAYTITAFGTAGNENLVSQAVNGDFNYGTVCDARITASALRIREGESVTLSVNGCVDKNNNPGSVVWKVNGVPIGSFISQTITPTETTTYTAACLLTDSNGQPSSCSDSKEIIVDKKCTGVVASVSHNSIDQGQAVILRATGCEGSIEWRDGYPLGNPVGNQSTMITYPTKNSTYSLSCMDEKGNSCLSTVGNVSIECNLQLSVMTANVTDQFGVVTWNRGYATVTAVGCPGKVEWERIGGKGGLSGIDEVELNLNTIQYQNITAGFEVKATCSSSNCSQTVFVPRAPKNGSCNSLTTGISIKPTAAGLILEMPSGFKWTDNRSGESPRTVTKPLKATVFSAEKEGCITSEIYIPPGTSAGNIAIPCAQFLMNVPASVEIPYNKPSQEFTATMSGCTSPDPGIVTWKWLDPTGKVVATGTGTTAKITIIDADKDKTFTFSASCKIAGRENDEEKEKLVRIKKQVKPISQPTDPCNFYYWTNRPGNYVLEQSEDIINVFHAENAEIQAFIIENKDRLVSAVSIKKISSTSSEIRFRTVVGNGPGNKSVTKGEFWIKIVHITTDQLTCEGFIQINVDNNFGLPPITLNPTPQAPVQKSSNCAGWTNPILPVIKNSLSWYQFENNSGNSSYGVISYSNDDFQSISRIGIIDKTCSAKNGTFNVYTSSARDKLSGPSTLVSYKNKNYLMFIDAQPVNTQKTYYARCTYYNGEYCDLDVLIDPHKNGYNARIGASEEETTADDQQAARPCMYSAKEATAVLLQNILCNKLASIKGNEKATLEALRDLLAAEGIALPPITDAMAADLAAGNCEKAVTDLTKNITGNKPVDALEKLVNPDKANELAGQVIELATEEELINTDFNPRILIGPSITAPTLRTEASACPVYYFSPVGKRIYIPNLSNCTYSINGVLMQFEKDGDVYIPLWIRSTNAFAGYFKKDVFVQKSKPTGEADVRIAKNTEMVALMGLERFDEVSGLARWQAFMNANKALITNAAGEFVTDAEFTAGMAQLTPVLAAFEDTPLFDRVEKFKAPYGPYLFNLDDLRAEMTTLNTRTEDQIDALKAILSDPAYECAGLDKGEPKICKVYQCVYNALQGTPTLDILNARLDLATRKRLITLLASDGSLTSGWSPVGGCAFTANGEATILSLIKTTPENDVLALLDYVRSNSDDPQLLRTLISKINYSDLVNALTYVVKSSPAASAFYDKTIPSSEQSLEEHLIVLNKGGLFGTDYIGKEVYNFSYENNRVKVTKRTITGFSQAPPGTPAPTVRVPVYSQAVSYELDPYELVVVVNHSRLSALQGELGVGNGEAVLLPAIALDYVAQQQMQATLLETVNLATIPIGGGQLSAALRAGKSAVALFEAAAIIGAAGQSALDANILPPAYRTQFSTLVTGYNTIIGLTGLGIAGGQGLPRLGAWVQRAATGLDSYKIGRSAAQTFLDQLTALKQLQNGEVWQQMLQANRQRLEALAEYLVTKGMKAGDAVVEGIVKARTLADLVKQAKVATLAGFFYVTTSFTGGVLHQAAHLSPQAVEIGLQTINQTDEVLFEATDFANVSTSQSRLGNISGLTSQGISERFVQVTLKKAPTAADIQNGTNLQTLAQSQTLYITRAETQSLELVEFASLASVVLLARPKDNQNTDCSICKGIIINGQNRNEICKSLEALAAKAGLTYKGIIENRLCKSALSNTALSEVITQLNSYNSAEIQAFLKDLEGGCSTADLCNPAYAKYLSGQAVRTWQDLYSSYYDQKTKAKFARTYWPVLKRLPQLSTVVKAEISKFSDASATGSTLKEFSDDLDKNNGFLGFVKDRANFAKGFVGHKQAPLYTANDYELLAEELKDIPLSTSLNDLVVSWLAYSKEDAKRQNYYKQGKDFENWIKEQLSNDQSAVYQQLKAYFTTEGWNLDDYSIYSQVYLCINGNSNAICTEDGSYFIADFVFVKEVTIGNTTTLDVKIADTKLSAGTGFTENQRNSKKQSILYVRTKDPTLIKGNPITLFNIPKDFNNTKVIYKIYSGGTTSSYGGIIK